MSRIIGYIVFSSMYPAIITEAYTYALSTIGIGKELLRSICHTISHSMLYIYIYTKVFDLNILRIVVYLFKQLERVFVFAKKKILTQMYSIYMSCID